MLPAILLATAAKLRYHVAARSPSGDELGIFVDAATGVRKVLVVAMGDAPGTDRWILLDSVPTGFPPHDHLVSRATCDVLQGGTANGDGSVTYRGAMYRMKVFHDGANLIAEAFCV
jgi:hypothetical protein